MSEHPPDEHGETWFGTGLRAHLGIGQAGEADSPAPAERVEPQPDSPPRNDLLAFSLEVEERARRVRDGERQLSDLERTLADRAAELARETERLAVARAELAAHAPAEAVEPDRGPVREILRRRAESEADRLWRTIEAALEAVLEDGRPDFQTRLAAVKLLLGEAYDVGATMDALPAPADPPADELARRRAERGP
jgi:hypothetical protein